MGNKEIINLIKLYFTEHKVKVNSMYLFGSRGRGDNDKDSDYDFLIVLDENKTSQEKRKITKEIRNSLIKHQIFYNTDLIIKNFENWEWESQNLGFLAYTVKNEGVLL
jgi:predicted nucleotidyltransferase